MRRESRFRRCGPRRCPFSSRRDNRPRSDPARLPAAARATTSTTTSVIAPRTAFRVDVRPFIRHSERYRRSPVGEPWSPRSGEAAARVYRADSSANAPRGGVMLGWAALSFLPDADVIGFGFGIDTKTNGSSRRHALDGVCAGGRRRTRAPGAARPSLRIRTGLMATLVLASHSLPIRPPTVSSAAHSSGRSPTHATSRRGGRCRCHRSARLSVAVRHVRRGTEMALLAPVLWYAFRSRTAAYAVMSRGPVARC